MIPSSKFFLGSFFRRISCSVFLVGFCSLLAFVSPGFSQSLDAEDNGTSGLSPFEQADLLRLIDLDIRNLSKIPIQGVLGYDQEYWRNPASVHVIRPEDVTLNGYLNSVEALRGVPGMHVTRGLAYDNFASMRNFSGFSTQKFLGKIGGREVSQLMLGSANYSVDDYPIAVIDRIEVIRGPGASIWGTNAVNGVINLVTKHSGDTQGDSFRIVAQDNGTFMGDYVHGGQVSEDSFYRVWARTQEYAEGTLDSGSPARDDGYLRKAGFRYDKELESDLNFTCRWICHETTRACFGFYEPAFLSREFNRSHSRTSCICPAIGKLACGASFLCRSCYSSPACILFLKRGCFLGRAYRLDFLSEPPGREDFALSVLRRYEERFRALDRQARGNHQPRFGMVCYRYRRLLGH